MKEQRAQIESQDGVSKWDVSMENVTALFDAWPVVKKGAHEELARHTGINQSWYIALSGRLSSEGLIDNTQGVTVRNKVQKAYTARSLYLLGFLAQSLRDQGLLLIKCPQRDEVICETIAVMRAEGDNLC